jgi:hypothetical protein
MSAKLATPEPRPVPSWVKADADPAQEVAALLRRHRAELAAAHAETDAARSRTDALALAVAEVLAKKQRSLPKAEFRAFRDLLEAQRFELLTHAGKPLTPELEEALDIIEWQEAEAPAALPGADPAAGPVGPGDWVAEAFEPEIRFEGRLLRRAKVVCLRVEKPPQADDASPQDRADGAAPAGGGSGASVGGEPSTDELPTVAGARVQGGAAGADSPAEPAAGPSAGQRAASPQAPRGPEAPGAAGPAGEAATESEAAASGPSKPPGRWRRIWAALTGRDIENTTPNNTEGDRHEDQ